MTYIRPETNMMIDAFRKTGSKLIMEFEALYGLNKFIGLQEYENFLTEHHNRVLQLINHTKEIENKDKYKLPEYDNNEEGGKI